MAEDDLRVLRGDPFRGVNVWPDMPNFQETMLEYFNAVLEPRVEVHHAVAMYLDLPRDFFDKHLDAPLATLRMLKFPGGSPAAGETDAGEHTDCGSLTFIMSDGVPGLQLPPGGGDDWIDDPVIEGAFIVNIADCFMRWTNDVYISTPHRVLIPQQERFSLAFFLDPNPDSVIEALPGTLERSGHAPKYPPITSADCLKMRLNQTYEKKIV